MIERYQIKGHSMLPFLEEGDRVLVLKTSRIKVNDVIIFRSDEQTIIKRVKKIDEKSFFVEGDNKADSRQLGAVPKHQIIGKLLLKY